QAVSVVNVGQPLRRTDQLLLARGIAVGSDGLQMPGPNAVEQVRVFDHDLADVTASSTGTLYFSSNPAVATVSPEGVVTATGFGDATITVVHGPAMQQIDVRVAMPALGTTTLGTAGGLVASAEGAVIGIAPGALRANTDVTVSTLTLDETGLPMM